MGSKALRWHLFTGGPPPVCDASRVARKMCALAPAMAMASSIYFLRTKLRVILAVRYMSMGRRRPPAPAVLQTGELGQISPVQSQIAPPKFAIRDSSRCSSIGHEHELGGAEADPATSTPALRLPAGGPTPLRSCSILDPAARAVLSCTAPAPAFALPSGDRWRSP